MANDQPLISVVVPTYNRPEPLRGCLEALAGLDYPRDRYEVVIVDDGSPTPLDDVVRLFKPRMDLRLIRQHKSGPATARNTGVSAAAGRFIAFTDDDCRPRPDWLDVLVERLLAEPDVLLGGVVVNVLTDNACSSASQHLVSYLCGYYNDRDSASFLTSNNMAAQRSTFCELGGFDTCLSRSAAEDRELCDRWRRLGRPVRFVTEAVVEHAHHLSPWRFWRQHFNYGRGAWYYHRVREEQQAGAIAPEPLRFYLDLVRYPFKREALSPALRQAMLMGVSQVANAVGYFCEAYQARRGRVPPRACR